jgi:release factor glutamine methyltransferase
VPDAEKTVSPAATDDREVSSTDPPAPAGDPVVARLRAAGCVFAEDEARLLRAAARNPDELTDMVERRAAGLPLEHIVGWAEFHGLRIAVEPGVFVPRRRTEFLVDRAIALARPGAVVLDLCCGSGAVGAAVAAAVPGVELHAVDIDAAAVRCARRNLPAGHVHLGDLYRPLPAALRGRVDVLVVIAPYVPTSSIRLMPPEAREHEPRVALDGGDDGLDVVRRLVLVAAGWLAPGGHLLVESSEPQAEATVDLFEQHGLAARIAASDDLGATVVIGSRSVV